MAKKRIKVVPYSPDGCTGMAVLYGPGKLDSWRAFQFNCYPNVKTTWGVADVPDEVRAAVDRHCNKVCTSAALRRRGFAGRR